MKLPKPNFSFASLYKNSKLLMGAGVVFVLYIILRNSVFYAEPGYVYHVRTILGNEHAVSDVGYQFFFSVAGIHGSARRLCRRYLVVMLIMSVQKMSQNRAVVPAFHR